MHIGGAAKRSSSAHALTATDRMDENGMHTRMNLRMLSGGGNDSSGRSNGDISRPRLRGELEMTPFIIPKSKAGMRQPSESKFPTSPSGNNKPSSMNSKLNTSTSSLQHQYDKAESPLDSKSVRSPGGLTVNSKPDISSPNRTQTPPSPNLPMQVSSYNLTLVALWMRQLYALYWVWMPSVEMVEQESVKFFPS